MTIGIITIADLQRKLNKLLKDNPNIDKNAVIVDAAVADVDDDTYPRGSLLLTCRCAGDRKGHYHILSIHPNRLNKYLC